MNQPLIAALPESVDVAIVGGGMVGASLALLLAAEYSHWTIALIETLPFREQKKHSTDACIISAQL